MTKNKLQKKRDVKNRKYNNKRSIHKQIFNLTIKLNKMRQTNLKSKKIKY